jgi:hypothetical protein
MGLINNIFLSLKTSLGRPLSRTDIYSYCDPFIKRAPGPEEWRPIFSHTFGKVHGNTLTVEDYYRDQLLRPSLDKIAGAPTVTLQRAACINEILGDMVWQNFRACLNKAKTPFGKAIIEDKLAQLWSNHLKDQHPLLLDYFYIMSLTVQACLSTFGSAALHIPKRTELEVELYRKYGEDLMMLDVNIMDVTYDIFTRDEAFALEIACWKDEHLAPVYARTAQFLEAARNKIAFGTFDIHEFKVQSERLDAERAALLDALPRA